MEGLTGVAQLTTLYLKNSGIYKSTASWPETKEAMFQLQQEDDSLQEIIKHVQTVNEPLQHQLVQKGHYGYQYILRQGEALQQQAIFTTPYNPNANGFAENQNRTIKDMLSAYVNDQQMN